MELIKGLRDEDMPERPFRNKRPMGRLNDREEPMLGRVSDSYIYFPLMSISDAAKYLGVSRKTIYRLIENDDIRAAKEGKAIRVEKMSLDAFRESGNLT
jgi:excisionase family DNA binding protein